MISGFEELINFVFVGWPVGCSPASLSCTT